MLPDVVGGWLKPERLQYSLEKIAGKTGVTFIRDRIEDVDLRNRRLKLYSKNHIYFDYLLLSTGAETNFHGNSDLSRSCCRLDGINDAVAIKNRLLELSRRRKLLNVVIIGGGYTGIELATNIRYLLDFYKNRVTIYIVEKTGEILPGLPGHIRAAVKNEIGRLGIKMVTGDFLKSYDGERAVLEISGEIPDAFCIWTAGVKTQSFMDNMNAGKINTRLETDEYLRIQCPFLPNVFVAGDAACFPDIHTSEPLRMAVMFSITQGKLAADNIINSIKGVNLTKYKPHDLGYIIPMAHGKAEGLVLGKYVHGFTAYLMHYFMCVYRSEWKNKPGIIKDLVLKLSGNDYNSKGGQDEPW